MLVFLFVVGLCLGSFVNALVWRIYQQSKLKSAEKKRYYSILYGRSMCPDCRHNLSLKDLIPVVSWILLKGKCRYCHKPISGQYPIVELGTAILCVLSYIWWPLVFGVSGSFSFALWLLFLTGFVALAIYDFKWFLLPDKIVYPLILIALIELVIKATAMGGGVHLITQALWGLLCLAGLFYLLYVVSGGAWIGFGDVKLAIVLGLLVGGPLPALLVVFFASVIGSIVALPLLIKGRVKATSRIPFGPLLLISTVIIVLFGTHLTSWYNHLFYLY